MAGSRDGRSVFKLNIKYMIEHDKNVIHSINIDHARFHSLPRTIQDDHLETIIDMKKPFLHLLLYFALIGLMGFTACEKTETQNDQYQETTPMKTSIKITVGQNVFTAELTDNPTTAAFLKTLPLTLDMKELNNNEKFFRLDKSLPTKASVPSSIRAGDLLLYGNNTLVLFYKSFTTSYSYTPMGSISNPAGLEAALGAGNVTVKFEIKD